VTDDSDKSYYIKIESIEEIMKMQNFYKNYDQMISDMIYEDNSLRFSNKDISDLKYVSSEQDVNNNTV